MTTSLVGHARAREVLTTYLPPATLLVGPPSVGKTVLARWAAEHHGAQPLDVLEVGPLTMDGARSVIASQIYRPFGKVRVAITELGPRSARAQNALLKVLEEPARSCHIILTADSLTSVLPTVISRSFVQRLRTLSSQEITDILTTTCGWELPQAQAAAELSDGTVASALAADEATRIREKALVIIKALSSTNELEQDNALASMRDMDGPAVLVALQRWAAEAKTGQWRWFSPTIGAPIIRRGRVVPVSRALHSGARPVLAVRAAFVAARPRL